MLFEQIKTIVDRGKSRKLREGYIINLIKEYLQNIILEYIYSNKAINNQLVFTGGTCLRFCFNLPRLSEDLDFDCEKSQDHHAIAEDIKAYFRGNLRYREIDFSVKGCDHKIYFKFPFLKKLDLDFNGSSMLLLKVEIARVDMRDAGLETSLVERSGRTYFLKRYSLPDLMAGKIHAFLARLFFKGKENEVDFKGRDIYDLAWYMGKNVVPNTKRLTRLFIGTKYEKMTWPEILAEIHLKAKKVKRNSIYLDLANFIENPAGLDNFLANYLSIIGQYYEKYANSL